MKVTFLRTYAKFMRAMAPFRFVHAYGVFESRSGQLFGGCLSLRDLLTKENLGWNTSTNLPQQRKNLRQNL